MSKEALVTAAEVMMSIFKTLPGLIAAIEQPGNGLQKAAAVTAAAAGTLNALPAEIKDKIHVDNFISTAQVVTGAVVEINNLAGVFKTGTNTELKTGEAISTPRTGIEVPTDGAMRSFDLSPSASLLADANNTADPAQLHTNIAKWQGKIRSLESSEDPNKLTKIANLRNKIGEAFLILEGLEKK